MFGRRGSTTGADVVDDDDDVRVFLAAAPRRVFNEGTSVSSSGWRLHGARAGGGGGDVRGTPGTRLKKCCLSYGIVAAVNR